MTITQPPASRLIRALRAAAAAEDTDTQPYTAALDELAAAIMEAPADTQAALIGSPGMQELHAWAQDHHERQQHAEFFALLARMKSTPPEDMPAEDFIRLLDLAPPRYREVADALAAETLPQATHCDDDGNAVFSIEQIAQHFGKTPEEVAAEIERLGLDTRLHEGPVHPLQ